MLLKLTIENYALIDSLDIDIPAGFSVITGETGAGKSILLGALGLLLGQRADTNILLNKERKCVVEGVFNTAGYNLESFFSENELDPDENTILRREINPAGKSRAFINDTPVNLQLLKEIGDRLVNIHSQNSIITLNDASFQMAVIDSYAGNSGLLRDFRKEFSRFRKLNNDLEVLATRENQARAEQDYISFQYNELAEAKLDEDEQTEAEQRLGILSHAGDIKSSLGRALEIISENEVNVLQNLSSAISALHQPASIHPRIRECCDRLESNLIDLKDVAGELTGLEEDIVFDQEEQERLVNRLDIIYRLEKKHNVATVKELIMLKDDLAARLDQAETLSDQIAALKNEIGTTEANLGEIAGKLSEKRKAVCSDVEKKVTGLLSKLGMPHAAFKVDLTRVQAMNAEGLDRVKFLFSANRGIEMSDVAKIASGGELSRLMLSIKSLISTRNLLPTIIFDEIDNGVSGEVAGKVGNILHSMGGTMQVIAITHLPQIAGQGSSHFHVFKNTDHGTTRSGIKNLSRDERVTEIARMLSNEKVTDAALVTARELLLN